MIDGIPNISSYQIFLSPRKEQLSFLVSTVALSMGANGQRVVAAHGDSIGEGRRRKGRGRPGVREVHGRVHDLLAREVDDGGPVPGREDVVPGKQRNQLHRLRPERHCALVPEARHRPSTASHCVGRQRQRDHLDWYQFHKSRLQITTTKIKN